MRFRYKASNSNSKIGKVRVILRTYNASGSNDSATWSTDTPVIPPATPTSNFTTETVLFSNQGYNTDAVSSTNGVDVQFFQRISKRLNYQTKVGIWLDIEDSCEIKMPESSLNIMTVKKLINTGDNQDFSGDWSANNSLTNQTIGSIGHVPGNSEQQLGA